MSLTMRKRAKQKTNTERERDKVTDTCVLPCQLLILGQPLHHCRSEPRAKSPKLLVHNRQVRGNRDLTAAGGTKTISKGKGRHKDRGRGKRLRGSTRWRYGRDFVFQNKAFVLCPEANACDKRVG